MSCAIELEIGAGSSPGEFLTRVVDAPSGSGATAVFLLDVDDLLRERDALENTVLASGALGRRIVPAHEQQLRRVGQQLFEALFSERVLGTYRASLGVAQQRDEPLGVVLRLTAPRLAALPWEALFDPEIEAYICRREPLMRHVPAPYTREPLEMTPPLRVLGLVASPRGLPALDVAAEQKHLSEALATPIAEGLIELEWLAQASWDGVHERLLSNQWHVLHFIGHGDYDADTDQGQIALEGEDGRKDLVEAQQLADLLGEARPTPRLVVLNSCSSGEQGTQDLFSGTAAALVRSGINAVAAMQFTISDPAAIAFARGFYTAIALGRSVDDASRSGRISMLGRTHSLEWVTPVLYVRGENTQLFSIAIPVREDHHLRAKSTQLVNVTERPPAKEHTEPPGTQVACNDNGRVARNWRTKVLPRRTLRHWSRSPIRVLAVILAVLVVAAVVLWARRPGPIPNHPTTPQTNPLATPFTLPFTDLTRPVGVAVDTAANLYVVDGENARVLKLEPGSSVPTELPFPDLKDAGGIAVDTVGNVYVTSHRSAEPGGGNAWVLELEAGSPSPKPLPFNDLKDVGGVAVDTSGNVYVTDDAAHRVLKLTAGSSTPTELPFTDLGEPEGVAVDTAGNVYVTDYYYNRVLKLTAGSSTPTELPFTGLQKPWGVAVDATANVYVTDAGGNHWVLKLAAGSSTQTVLPFTGLNTPTAVAVDAAGNVYVADVGDTSRVVKLTGGA